MSDTWRARARALAATLTDAGKLRSPAWRAAVENIPRHRLVPERFQLDHTTGRWVRHQLTGDADLNLVYSNTALFVLPDALSSSSMPGLMTRMLEDLDVADGHRVLEIGTGTGYNAALLCHRLGAHNVFSIDVEPDLVELARERLGALGYRPALVAGDGAGGMPDHAPFDRIIATCSVKRVPWSWIEQSAAGGRILVDLKIGKQAGNLVHLHRTEDGAEGRFDRTYGSFMGMRPHIAHDPAPTSPLTEHEERTSALDLPRPWENTVVWFLASLTMPRITGFGLRAGPGRVDLDTVVITAADGSRCEITPGTHGARRVHERGRSIWAHVEHAHDEWESLGTPTWDRFGLTVHADLHTVWLDHPDTRSWPLSREGTV